jgi:hypothetical protein
VIDHRVAQYPIKPRHGALFITHFRPSLQASHESRLKDILRDRPGFDALLQERQKLAVTIHQALNYGRRQGGRWLGFGRHDVRLSNERVPQDCKVSGRHTSASMKAHDAQEEKEEKENVQREESDDETCREIRLRLRLQDLLLWLPAERLPLQEEQLPVRVPSTFLA